MLRSRGCEHLKQVEDGAATMGNAPDAKDRIPLDRPDEAREIAEAALIHGPAGRQQFALKHDLGIGRHFKIDRLALDELDGRASKSAGQLEFVET